MNSACLKNTSCTSTGDEHSILDDSRQKMCLLLTQFTPTEDEAYVHGPETPSAEKSKSLQQSVLDLNDIELKMFTYISQTEPALCQLWLRELPGSRASINTQLQTALKNEGIKEDAAVIKGMQADWRKLRTELMDSASNLALSRALVRQNSQRLRDRFPEKKSLISILKEQFSPSDITVELDSLDAEGHPTHPCRRTRLGFLPSDSMAFTCEASQKVSLKIVALRHDHAIQSDDSFVKVLQSHYPFVIDSAVEALHRRGYNADQFLLTVIHPFQFINIIPQVYKEEIASGIIVLLPEVTLSGRPTNSTRTVLTTISGVMGKRLAIKTSIEVQITSVVRTVHHMSVRNGPYVSRLITRLLESNPRVLCVEERAGIAFADKFLDPSGSLTAEERTRLKGLSCVLRDDAQDYAATEELVIRCSALTTVSPICGRHFIIELLDTGADTTLTTAAAEFLDIYTDLLLSSTLTLLWTYGITIDAHLQNTLIILKEHDYRPTKLLLQDFGDVLLSKDRLLEVGVDIKDIPMPESKLITDDIGEVYNNFTHSVIFTNLKQVVNVLASINNLLSEDQAWSIIRHRILKIHEHFKETSDPESHAVLHAKKHVEYLLRSSALPHKAFVTMRLLSTFGYKEYFYMQANPLYQQCPQC